jgi:uncharacterized UPF0160 family protein
MEKTTTLVTHQGACHADEVAAVATYVLAHGLRGICIASSPEDAVPRGMLRVIRTRDVDVIERADVRVDVGMRYDPSTQSFDHHQKEGAGARDNGVPYASAGLVWKHYGVQAICATVPSLNELSAAGIQARVDLQFMQPIDSTDNGVGMGGPSGIQLPAFVATLNPSWMDETSYDDAFEVAVGMVLIILSRAIKVAAASELAKDEVLQAIDRAEGGVIVLQRDIPWQEAVCEHAPQARFVVHPASDSTNWNVLAVPTRPRSFRRRALFPASWAGLEYSALADVTGVEDAVFCHTARFIAVARSLLGAKRLASLAF